MPERVGQECNGKTWHKRKKAENDRAADRRARARNAQARRTLRASCCVIQTVRHRINGTPNATAIASHLRTFTQVRGLAFGEYAEASEDVHALIKLAARALARKHWRSMGARDEKEARGWWTNDCRKRLGVAVTRAYARFRASRITYIGMPRAVLDELKERRGTPTRPAAASCTGRTVRTSTTSGSTRRSCAAAPTEPPIAGGGRRARTTDAWVGHLWDAEEARERERERDANGHACRTGRTWATQWSPCEPVPSRLRVAPEVVKRAAGYTGHRRDTVSVCFHLPELKLSPHTTTRAGAWTPCTLSLSLASRKTAKPTETR